LVGFVALARGWGTTAPALAGALLLGQLESFSSFWASAFKEVLVFTLIIPVLWWRSMHSVHVEEDEE
jgi:branched-chain amino acid transport system permease protein